MERWRNYDDDLSGLEAFCERWLEQEEQQAREAAEEDAEITGEPKSAFTEEERIKRLAKLVFSERQAAATYKTLLTACEGNLRVLSIAPNWVLSLPALVRSCAATVFVVHQNDALLLRTGAILGQAGEVLPSLRPGAAGGLHSDNQENCSLWST